MPTLGHFFGRNQRSAQAGHYEASADGHDQPREPFRTGLRKTSLRLQVQLDQPIDWRQWVTYMVLGGYRCQQRTVLIYTDELEDGYALLVGERDIVLPLPDRSLHADAAAFKGLRNGQMFDLNGSAWQKLSIRQLSAITQAPRRLLT